jgi:hypothetical protein
MTVRRSLPIVSLVLSALIAATPSPVPAGELSPGFRVEVLIDGRPACEYVASGTRYIEALKGKDYALRIHNPLGIRVAVALAVDGLNTIDARHTSVADARKWVLDPYETITISGWQTSQTEARRFYFTSEEQSYGARLGQTENLGVISAVFFRERVARVVPLGSAAAPGQGRERQDSAAPRAAAPTESGAAGAPAAPSQSAKDARSEANEYAATGIGGRTEHAVRQVYLDLERVPAASLEIHYEYRTQLARLGIVPDDRLDPQARRQKSHGFSGGFCPDIR